MAASNGNGLVKDNYLTEKDCFHNNIILYTIYKAKRLKIVKLKC